MEAPAVIPIFVRPNPDHLADGEPVKVFDPVKRDFLPATGRKVQRTAYWMRRIAAREVLEGEPVSAAAEPALVPDAGANADKKPAAKPKAGGKPKQGNSGAAGAKVEG